MVSILELVVQGSGGAPVCLMPDPTRQSRGLITVAAPLALRMG